MAQGKRYRVITTDKASARYQLDILPYLIRNFSPERVIEIEDALKEAVITLESLPKRGSLEDSLNGMGLPEYRYILFRETRFFELKIIYRVDEHAAKVFVVDYFPTSMHPKRMGKVR